MIGKRREKKVLLSQINWMEIMAEFQGGLSFVAFWKTVHKKACLELTRQAFKYSWSLLGSRIKALAFLILF